MARANAVAALLSHISPHAKVALVLEAMAPTGVPDAPSGFRGSVHVLAPGCPCCVGNLALRVTLARILRLEQPEHLVIGLVDGSHQSSLRERLSEPPWSERLTWTGWDPDSGAWQES